MVDVDISSLEDEDTMLPWNVIPEEQNPHTLFLSMMHDYMHQWEETTWRKADFNLKIGNVQNRKPKKNLL